MKTEGLICSQCGKSFELWYRYEDWGFDEVGIYGETEVCSVECYRDWQNDNREELSN